MDPSQRYTIDEFLSHPWCNETPAPPPPPTPRLYNKDVLTGKPLDSPLLSAARGRLHEGRSPGIATLKEAFDITYAVHRMEEEGARRRKYNGRGAGGFLANLNEDEEDEEMHANGDGEVGNALGSRQRGAAEIKEGRAGPRDQGFSTGVAGTGRKARGRGAPKEFELDLQGATLLGRRNKKGMPGMKSPLSGQPIQAESIQTDNIQPNMTPGGEYEMSVGSPMHT